jgi:hypothetical protein
MSISLFSLISSRLFLFLSSKFTYSWCPFRSPPPQHGPNLSFALSHSRFPLPFPSHKPKLTPHNRRPTASGHTLNCFFCKSCGTRVIHSTPGKDVVSVKGGCIEGLDWRSAKHIWCKRAVCPPFSTLPLPRNPTCPLCIPVPFCFGGETRD